MRWIVLVLIFVNLGYFTWGQFRASQSSYQVSSKAVEVTAETGKRLILLSEDEEGRKEAVAPLEKRASLGSASTGSDVQCVLLGPFPSPELIDQWQQRLLSLGIESRERVGGDGQVADYWVHIPPLSGRDAAIRMLRELQAQKIDSFVITQGELMNGISLGLFSRSESAENTQRRLMGAGYAVEIKTLSRESGDLWLELDGYEKSGVENVVWGELVKQVPDIKKAKNNCKGIATVKEFL